MPDDGDRQRSGPHRAARLTGTWSALLLLAVPPAARPAGGPEASSPAIWQSARLGIRLIAPRGWQVAGGGDDEAVLSPPLGQAKVALFSLPLEGTPGTDVDAVADRAVASLRGRFDRFKMLGRREVEVAGLPGREIYFRGRLDGQRFRCVQTIALHQGHSLLLMYMAPEEEYARHLGDYDGVVRSVRLLPRDGG
jgi:hypothetical protein